MNEDPDRNESAVAKAARELAQLEQQTELTRATLSRLQQDVAEAQSRLGSIQSAQLLEANEQLVLSAMRSQTDADTAAQALRDLSRSAELDALTQLPNRVLLLDRLAHAIAEAKRRRSRLALLFVDLNNFKQINDALGHALGDQVLKLAAHRLASSVREADTVSRHGGDEFLILLTDVSQPSDAVVIADKVIATLAAPTRASGHVLRLTASIGISLYPDDGEDADTLIDRADAAMYRAKRYGLGSAVFHGKEPAERHVNPPALASLQRPHAPDELALAEHERRRAELREANEQLLLAALGAQELQAAAEQAQRRQTDLLAVLAHELRNSLTHISTAAATLGRVRVEELLGVQAMIERQVTHLSRLVGDLLAVSRVNSGKLTLDRQVTDLHGIIGAAVDACQSVMDTRRQHFEVHVPSGELEVYGDAIRLTQVLSHLLDNASKYTPDGGEIGFSVRVVDDSVAITVSDNGVGMTAEALPQVFEPFVQGTHAIKMSAVGLRTGLMVVREFVKAHGGQIVARTAGRGLGSQFIVTLPLARCAPLTEAELAGGAQPGSEGRTSHVSACDLASRPRSDFPSSLT